MTTEQPTMADLLQLIEQQQAQIDELSRLVLQDPPAADTSGEAPIDWLRIAGDDRRRAWEQLAAFVETIVYRFDMQLDVTPCWWLHGEAVEELSALWLSRKAAYRPGAGLQTAMSWLDTLNRSRDRLHSILLTCREGHVTTSIADRGWMSDDYRSALHDMIRAQSGEGGPHDL